MIFPKEIDNLIIETVVSNWPLSVNELKKILWKKVSQPNLYKKISEYVDKHIFVKNWKNLDVNKKWILWYLNLAQKLESKYINNQELSIQLKEWEHSKYTANSLYELDSLRASKLAELNLMHNYVENNYIYNAHTYHVIWMPNADLVLFENIWTRVPKTFFLVWGDTEIDIYWTKLLAEVSNTNIIINQDSGFPKSWFFINVVWDFYIEVVLPEVLNEYFELIFSNTQNIDDLNIDVFKQLFHLKTSITITIYRNKVQARKYSKQIELSFKKFDWNSK